MTESALLDIAAYTAPPVFQAERRRIFGTGWQVVGPTASFDEAGSYSALGLGGWALLLLRGVDGAIRAFHNVCAHQKMPVIDNGRGHCDLLRCRYHGWTYDAAGTLVSAPGTVAPDGELSDYGLEPLPTATARGLVFARLDEDQAGDPAPEAAFADLAGLTLVADETRSLVPNWKAVLDVIHGGEAAPPVSAAGRFAWLRPVTGLWEESDGTVMLLVVPRTFRKTELHVFALAADPATSADLVARASAWTDRILAAAMARQQAIDTGAATDAGLAPRLAPLHGWIRSALAEEKAA
jgi:nitrite reductase/ring-hydroxylating ferredoxin subunit